MNKQDPAEETKKPMPERKPTTGCRSCDSKNLKMCQCKGGGGDSPSEEDEKNTSADPTEATANSAAKPAASLSTEKPDKQNTDNANLDNDDENLGNENQDKQNLGNQNPKDKKSTGPVCKFFGTNPTPITTIDATVANVDNVKSSIKSPFALPKLVPPGKSTE